MPICIASLDGAPAALAFRTGGTSELVLKSRNFLKQRGRKSIASLSVVSIDAARKPIEPPASLQRQAKVIFHQIVASMDPKHFRQCDVTLVASLAVAEREPEPVGSSNWPPWMFPER